MAEPTVAVEQLLDRLIAAECGDLWLHEHRTLALVADRRHRRGLAVSDDQRAAAQGAAGGLVRAEHALAEARAALDGPVLLMKGPEVAQVHERPVLRPFGDVDILVPDPAAAVEQLRACGFMSAGDDDRYRDHHHEAPLMRLPMRTPIEVHRRPGWVSWSAPPGWAELAASAEPARTSVPDVLRPADAHHAVLVAVHSWRTRPYGMLLDLVDIWLLADRAGPAECAEVARRWGVGRLWRTMRAAAESVVGDSGRPSPGLLALGRHLRPGGRVARGSGRSGYALGLLVAAPPRALPGAARRGLRRRSPSAGRP